MGRRNDRPNQIWFNERIAEAESAAARGDVRAAADLFADLVAHCHAAARNDLSEWREIQARWLLGVLLEKSGHSSDAARQYASIAKIRRDAAQEAVRGLTEAVAAAAQCEFKAGRRKAGLKLASEALRLSSSHPLPAATVKVLQTEVTRGVARGRTGRK
jgi:hypothetical protein